MLTALRTDSNNSEFIALVNELDRYLAKVDGEDHSYYSQFNHIDTLEHCVVVFEGDTPLGCGAIKSFQRDAMEVKRMFTLPESRGKGVATKVLQELEAWTTELGLKRCVLETGLRLPEAIGLYTKLGYTRTANYGQYVGIENSLCFEKTLR